MKKFIMLLLMLPFFLMFIWSSTVRAQGGPVVLMGIDAEDGGVGGHGPITVYESVVGSILSQVTNGGAGILVIGGGKSSDDVTEFWDAIAAATQPVTYVNGAAAISAASFAGFAMIAVVSDENETSDGGLSQDENDALATRQVNIASFVNGGGGLLGFSSTFPAGAGPYAYLAGVGSFTVNINLSYSDITPTTEGLAIGITDDLDVCCWHNEYITFPGFLAVLSTNVETGNPAAIGGINVVIGTCQCPPDSIKGCVSGQVTDGTGAPIAGKVVKLKWVSKVRPNDLPSWKKGKHWKVVTDSNGCYIFDNLIDGRYDVFMPIGRCRAIGGGSHQFVEIVNGSKVNDVNFECE